VPDLNKLLQDIVASLDISPSDFKTARSRYRAIRQWLLDGNYQTGSSPKVYLQGSFRLGTVIRPFYDDRDGDFDIDQVFEFAQPWKDAPPAALKRDVGDRLKSHGTYNGLLDEEGKRCWTLQYASEEGRPGFHIDVLPSKQHLERGAPHIKITNKEIQSYTWHPSSPDGYYHWFKSKNHFSDDLIRDQSTELFETNRGLYDSRNDVPKRLLRTPLQRSIQLLKRHRDVYFSNNDYKPISIIITTITTHLYNGENLIETIRKFVSYVTQRHKELILSKGLDRDGILDYANGEWEIVNPVDTNLPSQEQENFADRWNLEPDFVPAFFEWVRALGLHIYRFEKSSQSGELNLKIPDVNNNENYATTLLQELGTETQNDRFDVYNLLSLILLGIEGKIEWRVIDSWARKYLDHANSGDVDRINFYQTLRHRGIGLPIDEINDIKGIIQRNSGDVAYVLCGNLLLGTATHSMLIECIRNRGFEEVFSWPILRLADPQILIPT